MFESRQMQLTTRRSGDFQLPQKILDGSVRKSTLQVVKSYLPIKFAERLIFHVFLIRGKKNM